MANASGSDVSQSTNVSSSSDDGDDQLQILLQQELAYLCPADYMRSEREIQLKLEQASISKVTSDVSLGDVTKQHQQQQQQPSRRLPQQSMQFWREQMLDWSIMVVDSLHGDRDTVAATFQLLDRYLVTELQRPSALPISRDDYQLFTMTCLYLAVKVLEPYPRKLSVDTLVTMSKQYYSRQVIEQTERDILSALQWRLHPPTALSFARIYAQKALVQLSPQRKTVFEATIRTITELSIADSRCLMDRPSHVGRAALLLSAQQMGVPVDMSSLLGKEDQEGTSKFCHVYSRLQRLYWE